MKKTNEEQIAIITSEKFTRVCAMDWYDGPIVDLCCIEKDYKVLQYFIVYWLNQYTTYQEDAVVFPIEYNAIKGYLDNKIDTAELSASIKGDNVYIANLSNSIVKIYDVRLKEDFLWLSNDIENIFGTYWFYGMKGFKEEELIYET